MTKTAILSDIHGNASALRAVLDDIQTQGCDRVFCLGDTINGMDPSSCITLLGDLENFQSIKGNAEYYLLTPDLESHPRKDEPMYQDLIRLINWWRAQMSAVDLEYVQGLPDSILVDDWWLLHDSPLDRLKVQQLDIGDLDEKYRELNFHGEGIQKNLAGEKLESILALMTANGTSKLFIGHTHEPSIQRFGEKIIINPGSAGLPLDGDPRVSWVLMEQDGNSWQPSIRRVEYNLEAAVHRLKELDFRNSFGETHQDAYIKMLQTGIHWRAHV